MQRSTDSFGVLVPNFSLRDCRAWTFRKEIDDLIFS